MEGGTGFDDSGLHIDNGNNSLLPLSENLSEFGQIGFWIHLEDVEKGQAPLRLVPKKHGKDMTRCVPLVCRAGTLCIFTNYTWHSASVYTSKQGQRFTWGVQFRPGGSLLGRLQTLYSSRERRACIPTVHRRLDGHTTRALAFPAGRASLLYGTDAGLAGSAISGMGFG